MAKIGFHLNYSKTDKNGFAPVRAKIAVQSRPVIKTLPFKVKVTWNDTKKKYERGKWNDSKQRLYNFRESDKYSAEYKKINAFLDSYKAKANDLFNDCILNDVPLAEDLVRKFFNGDKINLNPSKKSFWEVYDEYLKDCDQSLSPNTARMHKANKKKLEKFEKEMGYEMNFDSMNLIFFDEFKNYILFVKEHEYNYFPVLIRRLKSFLNWSYKRNYHKSREFDKFSAPEKQGSVIHLTFEELQQLINYPFEDKTFQRVRDFYCFGCLTGARFGDIKHLTKDNISDGSLKFTTEKTKVSIVIPLYEGLTTIINRYPDQHKLLPGYANQNINKYIKKACKEAGIKTQTENLTFKKNETIRAHKPKYKLIGSHTARKTFVCLAHGKGMDIPTIMSCTGIRNIDTIKRYLEVSIQTKEEKLNDMFGGLIVDPPVSDTKNN
ncbi:MAG: integrase catalytic domain-containing protein [Bacteroidetes bacterium]|nr:integrase catalytic domain-containing protein [Bacteroidota bacterium]